jgi:hypothetical protein
MRMKQSRWKSPASAQVHKKEQAVSVQRDQLLRRMLQDDDQDQNRSRTSSHSTASVSNDSTCEDTSGREENRLGAGQTMSFQPSRRQNLSSSLQYRRQYQHYFDGYLARNEPKRRQPRSPPPPPPPPVASSTDGSAIVYQMQDLIQLEPHVYLVYATARLSSLVTVNRNMVIVRHRHRKASAPPGRCDDELTLINPVRLSLVDERRILSLGRLVRLIRCAPTQGAADDAYYLEKFPTVRRWAPVASTAMVRSFSQRRMLRPEVVQYSSPARLRGSTRRVGNQAESIIVTKPRHPDDEVVQYRSAPAAVPDLPVHREICPDDHGGILPYCHVYCFSTAVPECAILIQRGGKRSTDCDSNLLVTGQVLQSHYGNPYTSLAVKTRLSASGCYESVLVIPPGWKKKMLSGTEAPRSMWRSLGTCRGRRAMLRHDLEGLLRLDFDACVAATGVMMPVHAKAAAIRAVEMTLPHFGPVSRPAGPTRNMCVAWADQVQCNEVV